VVPNLAHWDVVKSRRHQRIETLIRSNLIGDVVAQVVTLGVCLWLLKSPWMWALWTVRWVVVGAMVIALRTIRSERYSQSLLWLSAGHIIGVFGLVSIAPVMTPLAMLILVGDLFLASYLDGQTRTRFFAAIVISITGIALLRFQNWTGLRDVPSVRVALFAIISNTLLSGLVIPRSHRQHYNELCELRDRLGATEQRLSSAIAAERLAVSRALNSAPIFHLQRLSESLREIRTIRTVDLVRAISIADAAATEAQDALRSVRAISHGVFPELLQFGLLQATGPLLRDVGTVERFEIPSSRFAPSIETAIYVVLREWLAACHGPDSSVSIVLTERTEQLHLALRIDNVDAKNAADVASVAASPFAPDQIAAVSGESVTELDGPGARFNALIPLRDTDRTDSSERSTEPIEFEFDANTQILRAFARWGLLVTGIGLACSIGVLIATRSLPAVFVVAAMASLAMGVWVADIYIRRARYGISIGVMCTVGSTSALLLTGLLPHLTPVMALVVSFPLVLSLPHFSERALNAITFAQAFALTAISILGYLERPFVAQVVPSLFPLLVTPIASVCVAALIAVTMADTVRAVTDGSSRVQRELRRIVRQADEHRQTIERELHDGAQQMFVAISLQFRALSRVLPTDPHRTNTVIETVADLIQSATDSLDSVARGTLVPELDTGRLGDALRGAVAGAGCPTNLSVTNAETVSPEVARVVYFACHEALQNAAKHGGEEVTVTIIISRDAVHTDSLFFAVADNGTGFDPARLPLDGGLHSLMRRVTKAGGTIHVASHPAAGTTISGTMPCV
jgi:signal transduction histidine kinase